MWKVSCEYKDLYILKKNSRVKYYTIKDKLPKSIIKQMSTENNGGIFILDKEGNKIIKNSKSLNKPKYWRLNGQSLYNGLLHPLVRKNITNTYHKYFEDAIIKSGLTKIDIPENKYIKIAVNIYEHENSGVIPDIDNLWPLEKWFTDSLVSLGVIPDDSPKFVISNGEKCYKFIPNDQQRTLEFIITLV